MRLALALGFVLAAQDAAAGAWPRGEGRTFVSVGHVASVGRTALTDAQVAADGLEIDGYSTLFAERGLTEALTFGLDVGGTDDRDTWTALVFLRRSFPGDGPNVWAVELAVGPRALVGDEIETILRPSLQWGRGTDWGWIGVESYVELRSQSGDPAYKLDATLGWRRTDRASWIMQLQSASYPGANPSVRLAPSYMRRIGDRLSLELGVVADVVGREDVGVELGTWLEF